MDTKNFLLNFSKGWKNVLVIILILVVLTLTLSLAQGLKYCSSARLLVVQEYSGVVDPYVASKSTQYLSDILAEVVYSTSFFNDVMKSGFNIDDNFSKDEQKRKNQWNKTVDAKAINDTGIIVINTYHKDRSQAGEIAKAINYTFKTKHDKYHGGGDKVLIRVLDEPITSNYPVKPNLIVNLALAIVSGIILGAIFVYLFPDSKIRLWKKSKSGKRKFASDKKFAAKIDYSSAPEYTNPDFKKEELFKVDENNNIGGIAEEDNGFNNYDKPVDDYRNDNFNNGNMRQFF